MVIIKRVAGEIGGTVGVPAVLIVNVLVALLQALPSFCPPPDPQPSPAERVKELARDHPFPFKLRARSECRLQGIRRDQIRDAVDEIHRRALAEPVETLTTMYAEVTP